MIDIYRDISDDSGGGLMILVIILVVKCCLWFSVFKKRVYFPLMKLQFTFVASKRMIIIIKTFYILFMTVQIKLLRFTYKH